MATGHLYNLFNNCLQLRTVFMPGGKNAIRQVRACSSKSKRRKQGKHSRLRRHGIDLSAFAYPGCHTLQGIRQTACIGTTGLRHIRLAAALAADLLRDKVNQLACLDLADAVSYTHLTLPTTPYV